MGEAISNPNPHHSPLTTHHSPLNLHPNPSPSPKPNPNFNQVGAALSARSSLRRTIRDDLFGGGSSSASLPTAAGGADAGTGARRSVSRAAGPRMASCAPASIVVGRDESDARERGWEESSGGSGWAAAAAAALEQHGYCVLRSRAEDGVRPILTQTPTSTSTPTRTPTPTPTPTPNLGPRNPDHHCQTIDELQHEDAQVAHLWPCDGGCNRMRRCSTRARRCRQHSTPA